jgi:hypothetical protein
MNDSTNKDRQVQPLWGDDMESALSAQDRVLRSQLNAPSSPHAGRRVRAGVVFVIYAAALLGFLLILLLIPNACCAGNNTIQLSPNQTNANHQGSLHSNGGMRNSRIRRCSLRL